MKKKIFVTNSTNCRVGNEDLLFHFWTTKTKKQDLRYKLSHYYLIIFLPRSSTAFVGIRKMKKKIFVTNSTNCRVGNEDLLFHFWTTKTKKQDLRYKLSHYYLIIFLPRSSTAFVELRKMKKKIIVTNSTNCRVCNEDLLFHFSTTKTKKKTRSSLQTKPLLTNYFLTTILYFVCRVCNEFLLF